MLQPVGESGLRNGKWRTHLDLGLIFKKPEQFPHRRVRRQRQPAESLQLVRSQALFQQTDETLCAGVRPNYGVVEGLSGFVIPQDLRMRYRKMVNLVSARLAHRRARHRMGGGEDGLPYGCLALIRDSHSFDICTRVALALQVFHSPLDTLLHRRNDLEWVVFVPAME